MANEYFFYSFYTHHLKLEFPSNNILNKKYDKFKKDILDKIQEQKQIIEDLCKKTNIKNPLDKIELSKDILTAVKQIEDAYNLIINKERNVDTDKLLKKGFIPKAKLINDFINYIKAGETDKTFRDLILGYLNQFKQSQLESDQNYLNFEKAYAKVSNLLSHLYEDYGKKFNITDEEQHNFDISEDVRLPEILIFMHLNNLLAIKGCKISNGEINSIKVELLKPIEEIEAYIKPNHIEYLGVSMDLPDMTNVMCNGKHIPFSSKRPHKELSFLKMLIENRDDGVVYNEALLETLNITKRRNKTSTDQKTNIRNLQKERLRNLANELNKKLHKVSPNIKIIKDGDRYFLIPTD